MIISISFLNIEDNQKLKKPLYYRTKFMEVSLLILVKTCFLNIKIRETDYTSLSGCKFNPNHRNIVKDCFTAFLNAL